MGLRKLLVANRGEIAIRISRAAADLGIATVAVHPADDAASLHTRVADDAAQLPGRGAAAYLDIDAVIAAALDAGCDAVHPGYGFLAENPAFASACERAGLTFVGPSPEMLALFGDKVAARALALDCGVPVLAATTGPTTLAEAEAFFDGLGAGAAVMVKALAGGGGRGMRPVTARAELGEAIERCRSEAQAAFGNGDVYVEQLLGRARHIEVQIVGDGAGAVSHVWERECSVQRQRQKVLELAPAPALPEGVRRRLLDAAVRLGAEVGYRSLGTVEFLVESDPDGTVADDATVAFLEVNARVQVEHTVTEAVTGLDLVAAQLRLAGGASLAEVGLTQDLVPPARGFAVQARVNLETMNADGTAKPAGGVIATYDPPTGPGVRVDGYGYAGYRTSPSYDSLLAKVVVAGPDLDAALRRTGRALAEFRLEGVGNNLGFLRALAASPDVAAARTHTRWVDDHVADLLGGPEVASRHFATVAAAPAGTKLAGARVSNDPLAVLAHGKAADGSSGTAVPASGATEPGAAAWSDGPDGTVAVAAPLQGTIVSLAVAVGDEVAAGQQVLVMESMKMEHVVTATVSGVVRELGVEAGDAVYEGHPLLFVEEGEVSVR
ncbi:MAG: carbamoyl-phosphate synthase large subunit, partial [Acidimicrobiia bacterium]|nr:carbamoyl-phosphate synthase large subunit [Acidimicrobiia bacterium]